ncbi:HNH endonuclease signature motif containing protein [Pseudonocardia ailaonensis]
MFTPSAYETYAPRVEVVVDSLHGEVRRLGGLEKALEKLVREIAPDHSDMDDKALIEAIVEQERLSRIHAAHRTRLVAELQRRRPGDEPGISSNDDTPMVFPTSRWVPDELGLVLGMSRLTAKNTLMEAARLEKLLPATLRAFEKGRIDGYRARIIHDLTLGLPDDVARAVEAIVLPGAGEQTYAQLRAAVREAIMRADPEGANRRHEEARRRRLVEIRPEDEGMAALRAALPATEAERIWHRLSELARAMEDERSLDQRRADLVADLLLGRLTLDGDGAAGPVASTQVQVVVGLDTLTGASEQPGHLMGYGPIPADLAREAALDGVWRRLVTDPLSGALLDHGRTTYRPPKALADFVRARDQVCRMPICRRRAVDAELDHPVRWADGGETSEQNITLHCKLHNLLKEQQGWEVLGHTDGSVTWITPTGHGHTSRPYDYRPHTTGREPPDADAPGTEPDQDAPPF